jgi:hypothetical protein
MAQNPIDHGLYEVRSAESRLGAGPLADAVGVTVAAHFKLTTVDFVRYWQRRYKQPEWHCGSPVPCLTLAFGVPRGLTRWTCH